jgi:WD40 repeat protein
MRHSCCVILIGVAFLLASCTSPIPLPSPIYGAIPTNPPPFSPSPSPAPTISPTPTPALFAVTQIAQIGKGEPARIAYSPDGKLFAVATSVGIYIYKVETMEEFRFIETEARNDSIAFSPDGRTLAGGSDEPDNMVGLWMVSTGQLLHTLQGHTGRILSVAYDPSGQTLAPASGDGTTRLWDVTTGKLLSVDKEGGGSVVVFSPDGTLLADAGVNVRLLDVKTGELIRTFNGDVVAISPNGRILASGASYGLGLDGKTVWLWDISTGKLLRTIKGAEYVSKLIFSPDGGMLAGSSDKVWLWNTNNGQLLRTIKGSRDMAFSPNGQTLASIDNVGNVQLWDAKTGQLLHSLDGYTQIMTSVAFSPDGQT